MYTALLYGPDPVEKAKMSYLSLVLRFARDIRARIDG